MTDAQPPDLPEFRGFIRGKRAALFGFMANGCALALNGDVLTIIPRNDIYNRYLNDKRGVIADLASEFFGRPIEAVMQAVGTSEQESPAARKGAQSRPPAKAAPAALSGPTRSLQPDPAGIAQALELLCEPGQVYELRAPNTKKGTVSGYFDDLTALARAAIQANQPGLSASGVYFSINPVTRDLLARSANAAEPYAKHTTADTDIVRRRFLFVDLDSVRAAGISATDTEHEAPLQLALRLRAYLTDRGWPAPMMCDSGNGAWLISRIDLPNDLAATALIKRVLEALALTFDDETVAVDRTTFNAGRIVKIPGTVARKGSDITERPHRVSRIIDVGSTDVVSREQLEQIAALIPDPPPRDSNSGRASQSLADWIAVHGIAVKRDLPWNGGTRFILERCLFDSSHHGTSAALIEMAGGAKVYRCLHNACVDREWANVRELFEPGSRERSLRVRAGNSEVATTASQLPTTTASAKPPEAMDADAFHGITGEFARLVEPHTESDTNAVIVQFLVCSGNMAGRGNYRMIDGARHSTNLMAVIVGDTSSSRKGSAWAQVRRYAALVDEGWAKNHLSAGLSSGEGLIWAVRDPIQRREPIKDKGRYTGEYQMAEVDPGVSDKRLLVIESEFARVLKMAEREGNTLSITIRQAWETGDLQILTKNNPAQATGAHISIIGHITREELLRGLDSTEAANGFANRFLWACARRSKCLPFGGDLQDSDLSRLVVAMRDVLDWCKTPRVIEFSAAARAVWEKVYPALSSERVGLLGATVARAAAQVIRLSCLYAVLDQSQQIEVEHLRAGIAVWGYCEASAEYIFGDQLGDPDADAILGALRSSAQGLTRTQIRDLFARHLTTNRIERALTTLATHNLATIALMPTSGRAAEVWRANGATKATKATEGSLITGV